jgi:hypothetical protein
MASKLLLTIVGLFLIGTTHSLVLNVNNTISSSSWWDSVIEGTYDFKFNLLVTGGQARVFCVDVIYWQDFLSGKKFLIAAGLPSESFTYLDKSIRTAVPKCKMVIENTNLLLSIYVRGDITITKYIAPFSISTDGFSWWVWFIIVLGCLIVFCIVAVTVAWCLGCVEWVCCRKRKNKYVMVPLEPAKTEININTSINTESINEEAKV